MPRRRDNPEERLQRAVADFLAVAMPLGIVWTAFPAGGGGKVRGAKLKAMGLKPGWPDVQMILPPHGRFIGIELKAPKGRTSDEQDAVHEAVRAAGGHVFICRCVEEVEGTLRALSLDLRASVLSGGGWRIGDAA